jgi:PLD-like domain
MLAASDDATPGSPDNEDPEQWDDDEDPEQRDEVRGLHAKVFCVSDKDHVHAIVGSANLTNHAWLGRNWEAFFVIRGSHELADELWQWCEAQAHIYRLPNLANIEREPQDPLDDLRNELAEVEMLLIDIDGQQSRLVSDRLSAILGRSGCTLNVARFTTPSSWAQWRSGDSEARLEPCESYERTSFVLMRGAYAGREAVWVHNVRVDPPIGQERDREAFVRLLGVEDFLRYLEGLLDEAGAESISTGSQDSREGPSAHARDVDLFRLEDLLRRLNRDIHSLDELDETVQRYQKLFATTAMPTEERERMERFLFLWAAISTGMRMP